MRKVILLSLLMLNQACFGQDGLEIGHDELTIEIDSIRTIKQNLEVEYGELTDEIYSLWTIKRNFEDKYSRYFELKDLLKDVNNRLENHTTLPRSYSVQDLKTYRNKYLEELKVVSKPTDKEKQEFTDATYYIRVVEHNRQQIKNKIDLLPQCYGVTVYSLFDYTGKRVLQTCTNDGINHQEINIYPNPASDIININNHTIKVSHLRSGVYILKIESGGASYSRKVIIK